MCQINDHLIVSLWKFNYLQVSLLLVQKTIPNVGAAAVDVAVPNAGAEARPVPTLKPTTANMWNITPMRQQL